MCSVVNRLVQPTCAHEGFADISLLHKRHPTGEENRFNGCMRNDGPKRNPLLPEWNDGAEVDDATWIEALEASRRQQFAELADL